MFSVWPITAIILAAVFPGDRLTTLQIFGVILCFTGVLVVVARGIMYLLFNTGVAMPGAAKASVTFYLQTLFTVILACLLLGEQLHLYHAVGIALIATGIIPITLIKPATQGTEQDLQ